MNLDAQCCVEVAGNVAQGVGERNDVEVALCPPYVYLTAVAETLRASRVGLAGQNMYHKSSGAYTGEISAAMLLNVGCQYVILGHSERRHFFGDTNETVQQKVTTALDVGLTPIVCVGESLQQRKAGQTMGAIREQFRGSLAGISAAQMARLVVAYEPVWAIGTGEVATPKQAEEVHANLRELMENVYDVATAQQVRIQYGGSVKPDNAAELMAQPNVDGALVGGASLEAETFLAIVDAACRPCT